MSWDVLETHIKGLVHSRLQLLYSKLPQTSTPVIQCFYKKKTGANKGHQCDNPGLQNGYCKTHQNTADAKRCISIQMVLDAQSQQIKNKALGVFGESFFDSLQKTHKITDTTLEWLKTAVPQNTTILSKFNEYFIHPETDFVFRTYSSDIPYIAIGKKSNDGDIIKLNRFDVEIALKYGWAYDSTCIETSSHEVE